MEWELKPGDTIDGWKLTKSLGKGGKGEVWVAQHAELGQRALKLLKLQFQGESHKRYLRFRDEATMHGSLAERHAGVLPFLGCSLPQNPNCDMPAWLATPVALPMREVLTGRPVREAVEAIASVAETLAALHEQSISHRDIKPENLFRYEDRWVIGDFGLVDYPDKGSVTDTGERLGPIHYLAPEMLDEAKHSDGRRADVYSLGKTLWVLATEQHLPLPGELRSDNMQLSIRAYRADPRNYQLDILIERATRNDIALRPTMAEFAKELRAFLATPTHPVSPTDISDLAARLSRLTEPARKEEDAKRERFGRVHRLGDRLEGEMATLRTAIESALGPSGASILPVSRQDGNVSIAIQQQRPPLAGIHYNDTRTLSVYVHLPARLSLHSGFGLELYENDQLLVFGGHVVRNGNGPHELVWSVVRVVWADSAEMEHAFNEVISGMNENLRLAVERLVGFLE